MAKRGNMTRSKEPQSRQTNGSGGQVSQSGHFSEEEAVIQKNERQELTERKRRRWVDRCMIAELAIIILLLLLFLFLFWLYKNGAEGETGTGESIEYEDNALAGTESADAGGDSKSISIAVMHDYVVSKDKPAFTVGYPDQNTYEIEISFRDSETGKEKYHTKRIKPGTQISAPGYEFCETGKNRMDAVIGIYKPKSQEAVSDSTTMQLNVTKE